MSNPQKPPSWKKWLIIIVGIFLLLILLAATPFIIAAVKIYHISHQVEHVVTDVQQNTDQKTLLKDVRKIDTVGNWMAYAYQKFQAAYTNPPPTRTEAQDIATLQQEVAQLTAQANNHKNCPN